MKKAKIMLIAIVVLLFVMTTASSAISPLYTESDVIKIAKTLYGECRSSKIPIEHKAAVVWCILNRVDDDRFPDTIDSVITRGQFHGYSPHNPVWPELEDIARDVLARWTVEKIGIGESGRVLPKEYLYFAGKNGLNRFRSEDGYWDWRLDSPYRKDE